MKSKIVLIDDDRYFRKSAQRFLDSHLDNIQIFSCDSAEEGERLITLHRPQIVLLDIKLPGIDGMALLKRLPHGPRDAYVIVVSGQPASDEQNIQTYVEALGLGAYYFHRKGDGEQRLLAQVSRLLQERANQRTAPVTNEVLKVPELDLALYRDENRAENAGLDVKLTPVEGKYLGLLMENYGKVVPLVKFYEVLCDAEEESDQLFDQSNKQTIRTHICYLRKKLGQETDSDNLIRTVRTKGYMLAPQ